MMDPALQQQLQQTKQIKSSNGQLSQKYSKYLTKTLATLSSSENIETELQNKVQTIYSNQEIISQQRRSMMKQSDKLSSEARKLLERLAKTQKKLMDHKVRSPEPHKINNPLRLSGEKNALQERLALLDQQIRVLESCVRIVENNNSVPVVQAKRGLFS